MFDIRTVVANTPGKLARAMRALADEGVDIRGLSGDIRPGEQWGYVHLLVEDYAAAARVLDSQGCEVLDVHKVELVEAEDRIGSLAEILEGYRERQENIEVLYVGNNNQIIIGTENMRRRVQGGRMSDARYSDTRAVPDES